ncbi:MAG: hypothetical protein HGA47_11570, partial [Zoogloea sp.]|nr:hypothetical protein [Zoogloea sp.]
CARGSNPFQRVWPVPDYGFNRRRPALAMATVEPSDPLEWPAAWQAALRHRRPRARVCDGNINRRTGEILKLINLNYWAYGDYLGIGAGAHGKLSSHTGIVREMRHKHPAAYLEAAKTGCWNQERREVGADELPFEFMMNALRLTGGFPRRLFQDRTGLPLSVVESELVEARRRGLLEVEAETLRPTETGRRFLNDLLTLFLREA